MRVLFHQQPCIPAETNTIVDEHRLTLQEELAQSRFALEIAYSNFDNVTDPDLIDCYIYEVNAVMKRYKYLLERAAETELLTESRQGEAYRALSLFS
ncbi:MAG: YaaL family protein [Lachnospiraceae bacterium]